VGREHTIAHELLAEDLERIARHFKVRPRLTLIVRHPGNPDQNVFLSDDNWQDVVHTVEQLYGDAPYFAGPPEPEPKP